MRKEREKYVAHHVKSVVTFLIKYISKRESTPSVKGASVMQTRPAKQQKTSAHYDTFKQKIKLKKYSTE